MTVRDDMNQRIKDAEVREAQGNFGARIMRFGLIGAMERMTEEELEREIENVPRESD